MSELIVITGGSRGIGAATAVDCARAGWDVLISYREQSAAADAVLAECRGLGVRAEAVGCDVAVPEQIEAVFSRADELAPLRGLVANAGVVAPRSRLVDLDPDRIARLMQVNVTGAILCVREAVRRMSTDRGGRGGSIVTVSSRAATLGSPGEYVDYAASKAAVDTMTVGLSKEVAAEGIRVNAVRPGLIDTDIHASGGEPDRIQRLLRTVPMGRAGTAAEVAHAIRWLLGDEASFVTGALLDVGGGR